MGAVVDVSFPRAAAPDLHRAEGQQPPSATEPDNLTLEVAQHLGDNAVRTIAMDTTDGLVRGAEVVNTGDMIRCRSAPAPSAA
jgi:F-type H+/Na+-transporting ATPase subunit beta